MKCIDFLCDEYEMTAVSNLALMQETLSSGFLKPASSDTSIDKIE